MHACTSPMLAQIPTNSRPLHERHRNAAAKVASNTNKTSFASTKTEQIFCKYHASNVAQAVRHSYLVGRRQLQSKPATRPPIPEAQNPVIPGHPPTTNSCAIRCITLSSITLIPLPWTTPLLAQANRMPIRRPQAKSGPTPRTSSVHIRLASTVVNARQNASWVRGQMVVN